MHYEPPGENGEGELVSQLTRRTSIRDSRNIANTTDIGQGKSGSPGPVSSGSGQRRSMGMRASRASLVGAPSEKMSRYGCRSLMNRWMAGTTPAVEIVIPLAAIAGPAG